MSGTRDRLGYIVVGGMRQLPAGAVLEQLATAGATAVDWDQAHFDPVTAPARDLVALVEQTRSAGLETAQFIVAEDLVAPDEAEWEQRVARTERAIDACAEAGIGSIDVITGPKPWDKNASRVGVDITESAAWSLVLGALERILQYAEGSGVTVAVETVWGTLARSAYRADYLLTKLRHPSLGLTVDPSHFVLTGDDHAAFIERWSDIVTHVHIKDAIGTEGKQGSDFIFTLPGEGGVDWPAFFPSLATTGYDGPMMVEFESYGLLRNALENDDGAAARLSLSLARGLVETQSDDG